MVGPGCMPLYKVWHPIPVMSGLYGCRERIISKHRRPVHRVVRTGILSKLCNWIPYRTRFNRFLRVILRRRTNRPTQKLLINATIRVRLCESSCPPSYERPIDDAFEDVPEVSSKKGGVKSDVQLRQKKTRVCEHFFSTPVRSLSLAGSQRTQRFFLVNFWKIPIVNLLIESPH